MNNFDSINSKKIPKTPHISISSEPPRLNKTGLPDMYPKTSAKKTLKKVLALVFLAIIFLMGVLAIRAANLSDKIFVGRKTSFFDKVRDFIRGGGDNAKLVGEDLGQINILLLGIGGEGHDGPYLSDTMMLAQIRPDIGQVALVSIPRDYWTTFANNAQGKVNQAFSDGYTKNKDWNEGGRYARLAVENITGLQVPYFAVLDFSGFEKAINQVGGVNIQVERTFTDYSYPDNKNGYLPPLTFTQGLEQMDGTRALQFARSRHAAGVEGSDFARSQRQKKIIDAFKQKVTSLNLITNVGTINSLLGTFADHFHTNVSPSELLHVYNLIKDEDPSTFITLNLDPTTSLICPVIREDTGAYTLAPCPGKSSTDVQNFFKNIFTFGKISEEKSVIWLSTSTGDKTEYEKVSNKLKEVGLTVWELSYKEEGLSQSVFYQVNKKPATAEFIKNSLGAREVSLPPPGVKTDKNNVDIIIILGENNN